MSPVFAYGDLVLLVDRKNRRYLVRLVEEGQFHSHAGYIPHADFVGQSDGHLARSTRGGSYLAVTPTLAEFIIQMPRGAQVIYPKDIGAILMNADIFPGARVLEAGVGSGALSMGMLRVGADIVGYELREDFAAKAVSNVTSFLGAEAASRYRVELRDIYDGIDERGLDRIVLDLPEPWNVVKHAQSALRPGGILFAYVPSTVQVARFHEALADSAFDMAQTIEVLHRGWYVKGDAVRPDHRMVGHTGFLTTARLLGEIE
ncbi:MAG: tRNA (adenine-N1)-methyltransferase [Acidimicrobiales bacterium]|nr:tRNA (adenine-N1)-methyltransferase [Acidimicrobiales bacterium]